MIRRFPMGGDRFGGPRLAEAGYALPLALAGALVLLLSSLSTLSTTLHGRRLVAMERSERLEADAMASAAQQVTAALQGPFHCLLPVAMERWVPGALPPPCPASLDPTPLKTTAQWRGQVRLVDWQPTPNGGEFRLQWVGGTRQQRYVLTLDPLGRLREVV